MKFRIFTLLVLTCLFTSCITDLDELDERAQQFAKSDGSINKNELEQLKQQLATSDDRDIKSKFYTNNAVDEAKLRRHLLGKGFKVEREKVLGAKNTSINVYIENSGSMNGYIDGNTEFKAAVSNLLVDLNYTYNDRLHLFFINSDIHPIESSNGLPAFVNRLDRSNFKVGNTVNSDLNNIFKQVLGKTTKNTISILISDCIYSIHGVKTDELLGYQKSLTKEAFLTKSKEHIKLNTTIVKLQSLFNGRYYDKNDAPTDLKNKLRPYYITVVGSEESMDFFNSKIKFTPQGIRGYDNKYIMSLKDFSKDNFYSIISTNSDLGRYRPSRQASNQQPVTSIEDAETDSRNGDRFVFSLAIDMSNIPTEEGYNLNPANYTISDGDYKILSIKKFDKREVKPSSVVAMQNANAHPTNYIVFESTSNKPTDLTFSLKRQIPKWVYDTNTIDDTNITSNTNKTFGFQYLVEGISDAYTTISGVDNYFEIKLKIN